MDISIHALLAESDRLDTRRRDVARPISIHALLAESDDKSIKVTTRSIAISIHALLAESDASQTIQCVHHRNFYPRSPCGERLNQSRTSGLKFLFLSTLSLRRATLLLLTLAAAS